MIIRKRNTVGSVINWSNRLKTQMMYNAENSCFKTEDGYAPTYLEIGKLSRHSPQDICHEFAHLYIAKNFNLRRYNVEDNYRIRVEMLAHRIAKSICSPKVYNESWAKCCLLSYFNNANRAVNLGKLKIIALKSPSKGEDNE